MNKQVTALLAGIETRAILQNQNLIESHIFFLQLPRTALIRFLH